MQFFFRCNFKLLGLKICIYLSDYANLAGSLMVHQRTRSVGPRCYNHQDGICRDKNQYKDLHES